ncbi:shikimate kinase [Salibacterium aidingense]|uniref:shikimate kinase n=1 Tax=Salibacterium aidingense TaxID=384933 RepID=UPI00041299F6|nr:shikimate kinase [Salibacterium aidingense]
MGKLPALKERNIALIGFMGSGKSTIGELLAKKIYRDFIDVDDYIEEHYQKSIPDIFREKGEAGFREIEKETTIALCEKERLKILALGGGAYTQPEIREACMKYCIVILLELSWDAWKQRLSLIIDDRPVLQNKTMEEIEELFYERKQAYALHTLQIKTDEKQEEEIADEIVRLLKLGWDWYPSYMPDEESTL